MKTRLPWWVYLVLGLGIFGYEWWSQRPTHQPHFTFDGPALVIHGGAGVITRENMSPAMEALVRASLERVLDSGYAALARGESRMDVVVRV
ncbi:MAG TPA: hypothetical protein DDY62_05585, partial [Cryomorphaceae bacterium]|nr:hypothetical protein [Cryomorphaceae bacterium]